MRASQAPHRVIPSEGPMLPYSGLPPPHMEILPALEAKGRGRSGDPLSTLFWGRGGCPNLSQPIRSQWQISPFYKKKRILYEEGWPAGLQIVIVRFLSPPLSVDVIDQSGCWLAVYEVVGGGQISTAFWP